MTKEEIQAMEAGRKLDALVGAKIMGLGIVDGPLPHMPKYYIPEYERTIFTDVPKYSTDLSAAWEVVEKMKQNEWSITIQAYGNTPTEVTEYEVTFGFLNERPDVVEKSAPEAICKAALLACLEGK